jgi:hypothetical protein
MDWSIMIENFVSSSPRNGLFLIVFLYLQWIQFSKILTFVPSFIPNIGINKCLYQFAFRLQLLLTECCLYKISSILKRNKTYHQRYNFRRLYFQLIVNSFQHYNSFYLLSLQYNSSEIFPV